MEEAQPATNGWAFPTASYPGTTDEDAVDATPGSSDDYPVSPPSPVRSAPVPQTRHQVQVRHRAVHKAKTRRIVWHILGWALAAGLAVVCFVLFYVPGTLAYVLNVAVAVALVSLVIALWPRRRTGRSVDVLRGHAPEAAPVPATAPEPLVPAVAASAVEHAPSAAAANTAAASAVLVHLQRSRRTARRREASRHIRQVLAWALVAAVVVVWCVGFRPQALGGRTEYVGVSGISMTPTMHNGDLAVVEKQASYRPGDIVVFHVPAGQPDARMTVIHRIVGGNGTTGFVTKGDHNLVVDPWHPRSANVVGRVWFHVPGALRWVMVVAVGVVAILLAMSLWPRRRATQRSVAIPQGPTPDRPRRVPGAGAPGPKRVSVASPDAVPLPDAAPVPAMAQEPAEPLLPSGAVEPAPAPVTAPEAVPEWVVGEPVAWAVATPDAAAEVADVPVPAVRQEREAPVVAARMVEPPTASWWVADPTVPAEGAGDAAVVAASWTANAPPVTNAITPLVEPVPAPETTEAAPTPGSYWDRTPDGRERPDPKKDRHHRGRRRRLPQP
jgi:signal peptidase I